MEASLGKEDENRKKAEEGERQQEEEAVVADVAVPSDSNIKKEYEKPEKHQELERTWKVEVKVVPVVMAALAAGTPKPEERFQQIPGTTSDQKGALLATAKILPEPSTPQASGSGAEVEADTRTTHRGGNNNIKIENLEYFILVALWWHKV